MEALGTCLAEPLLHCDSDQSTETILCLRFSSYGMSITVHLPYFLREVMRWLTFHDEGVTVLFCKMQDFSLNNLTVVYIVIAHSIPSQLILPINPGYVLFCFVFYLGMCFASDCIQPIVKILTGDVLIKNDAN